ncbi:hypothetical protein G5I_12829, partial [Acromyrmex echinatior]
LELIGLWPRFEQTTWEKCLCNLRVLLTFLFIIFVLMIPALYSLIRIHFDILLVTDNLMSTLPIITCVLRLVIFWWKREAVAPIIHLIVNDWTKTTTFQEKAIMVAKAQIARIIITFGYGMMAAAITVMAVLPIFGYSVRHLSNITADLERPLPIQTYYIYDTTRSPQYEMTYAVQSIASLLCIMCYTGIDSFLSLSVFHISGQLDILRNRLLHLHAVANFNNVLKNIYIYI